MRERRPQPLHLRVLPTSGLRYYAVGSDIGKGLTVLELDHELPGQQSWKSDTDLGPYDGLGQTMQQPL